MTRCSERRRDGGKTLLTKEGQELLNAVKVVNLGTIIHPHDLEHTIDDATEHREQERPHPFSTFVPDRVHGHPENQQGRRQDKDRDPVLGILGAFCQRQIDELDREPNKEEQVHLDKNQVNLIRAIHF